MNHTSSSRYRGRLARNRTNTHACMHTLGKCTNKWKEKLNVQLSVCSCKVAPNDHHLNNNNSRTLVIARSIDHQHTPAMHDKESQISEQCEARQSARIVVGGGGPASCRNQNHSSACMRNPPLGQGTRRLAPSSTAAGCTAD
jgi:hypothetical protein